MEEELEKERKIDRNGKPAHNKRYTLAAANRRLGVRSARSVAPLFPTPPSPRFWVPWKPEVGVRIVLSSFGFPCSGTQNLVYLER